jgi:uncharacterized protein (DUF433 family)
MGGVPCVAGTRIPVAVIISRLTHGSTTEELLTDYPHLHPDDIRACLYYANA